MSKIELHNCEPFYDCNIPPDVDGYICKELSEDFYQYEKIVNITRVEVIGRNGREFSKTLKSSFYEVSIQDDGKTLKLFEKMQEDTKEIK